MKREITSQVRETIRKLKASGFKRSDYSVQVERRYIPKRWWASKFKPEYEWGSAKIFLRATREETKKHLVKMLKEGLSVTVILSDNGFRFSVFDNYEQKLLFVRVSEEKVNFQRENCLKPELVEMRK